MTTMLTAATLRRIDFRILMLYCLATACTSFPKDPDHSLDNIRNNILRVGYTHAPPRVIHHAQQAPSGVEAELVKAFAQRLNARTEWVEGPEETLMSLLKENQLHIVIGGLTARTPWKDHAGLTHPYREERVIVCTTVGQYAGDIKGKEVAVRMGSPVAAYLKRQHAVPVEVDSLATHRGPIAVYESDKSLCSCQPCHQVIGTEERVMAVPMGENALLLELERFLDEKGY